MTDYCDLPGAMRLKDRIEAYWRERGVVVIVRLEEGGFVPVMRTRRVDVRSDMVDGWPREWAK